MGREEEGKYIEGGWERTKRQKTFPTNFRRRRPKETGTEKRPRGYGGAGEKRSRVREFAGNRISSFESSAAGFPGKGGGGGGKRVNPRK